MFTNSFCAKNSKGRVFSDVTCPPGCHTTTGKLLEHTSVGLDLDNVAEEFYKNTEKVDIFDNNTDEYSVVKVKPWSWKLPVTRMEEVYPLAKLLSDLGGMLGMWLGASVIGLINFLLNVRRDFIKKRKQAVTLDVTHDMRH